MYTDHTPTGQFSDLTEYWTVALVRNEPGFKEVHFGVFSFDDVREAMASGKIIAREDEHLELRRIRRFPV